ncbi:aminopeptidase [Bacillus spongiae]|uniref:Aminopeptidase n=1 Tax=Bacillus spongiae TaxID=2683610 RepID=A0ABU8HJZ9_9BACI
MALKAKIRSITMEHPFLDFQFGKGVIYTTIEGFESLTQLLTKDEGSFFLGEVALVQHDFLNKYPIHNVCLTKTLLASLEVLFPFVSRALKQKTFKMNDNQSITPISF